jgi:hypothetical protein
MRRTVTLVVLAGAMALLASRPGVAQQPSKEEQAAMQAMMEAYARYGAVGAPHQGLAKRVGTWKVQARFWIAPGAPAEVSEGKAEASLIMGGRYIMEKFEMSTPDGPFRGLGIVGYDNIKKRYQSLWIDSMSTGVMTAEGTGDQDARAIDYTGQEPDPASNAYKPYRSVEKQLDDDTRRLETFENGPDGKEFKVMELFYTRQ